MTVNKQQPDRKTLILDIEGSINALTAPELESILKSSLNDIEKLTINLEKVDYVSSAGLRILLTAHNVMEEKKASMVIKNINPNVEEIFDITGFSDILTIE